MPRPSEDDLIARHLAPLAGPGGLGLRDDAALATPRPGHDLVVTKDMLIAGVHFFADDPPDAIARKALRVNLSDLAAKGATPLGFLLGLALPGDWTEPWLKTFVGGLGEDARRLACPLLGGDTVATPGPLSVSITAFGEVSAGRMVRRTGARAGDHLYVTGTIGDAALGLRLRRGRSEDAGWAAAIEPQARDALLGRYMRPEPRLALAPALRDHARAAMDVSDGFLGDLTKMLRLEGLGAALRARDLPLSTAAAAAVATAPHLLAEALTGGDDYEILCATPPDQSQALETAAVAAGIVLTRIGTATQSESGISVLDDGGARLNVAQAGFQHFA